MCNSTLEHKQFKAYGGVAGPKFRRDTDFRKPREQADSIAEQSRFEADRRTAQGRKTALEQGQSGLIIP